MKESTGLPSKYHLRLLFFEILIPSLGWSSWHRPKLCCSTEKPGNSLLPKLCTASCPRTDYTDHSSPQNLLETEEFHLVDGLLLSSIPTSTTHSSGSTSIQSSICSFLLPRTSRGKDTHVHAPITDISMVHLECTTDIW